nr:YjcZ family sporulation protein [Anaerobacillus arseniciselenatis]
MPTYAAPAYGYGYAAPARHTNYFTLIVVLFILLVIVGASYIA